jgi:hypothetical protein
MTPKVAVKVFGPAALLLMGTLGARAQTLYGWQTNNINNNAAAGYLEDCATNDWVVTEALCFGSNGNAITGVVTYGATQTTACPGMVSDSVSVIHLQAGDTICWTSRNTNWPSNPVSCTAHNGNGFFWNGYARYCNPSTTCTPCYGNSSVTGTVSATTN